MGFTRRPLPHNQWGFSDYFDSRDKRTALRLAEAKPSDVLYDLGCGDASFLILAAEEFGIQSSVGFEFMPQRVGLARHNVRKHGLENRVTIKSGDFYKADLNHADILFHMLPEFPNDLPKLYSQKSIRAGTRLIKSDLPLLGFMADKIETPFYRMTFPLVKAKSKNQWAAMVLRKRKADISEVWHELYHYQSQKGYLKSDIRSFQRLLANRLPK